MTEALRECCRCVPELGWHRKGSRLLNQLFRSAEGRADGAGLGATREEETGVRERVQTLRQARATKRFIGRHRERERSRVGVPNVFAGKDDHAAKQDVRVLSSF